MIYTKEPWNKDKILKQVNQTALNPWTGYYLECYLEYFQYCETCPLAPLKSYPIASLLNIITISVFVLSCSFLNGLTPYMYIFQINMLFIFPIFFYFYEENLKTPIYCLYFLFWTQYYFSKVWPCFIYSSSSFLHTPV